MGKPRLLLEAASSYRGDQEDRLTELLAVALHEHTGFCRTMLSECDVRWIPSHVEVSTQEDIPEGPARIDLIIRAKSEETGRSAVIFIESKYNPDRKPQPYWFDEQQAQQEARALDAQPEMERHLVAVASDHDLASRDVPSQYEHKIRWRQIADLAYSSGGDHGWELKARRPDAPASQRILLEFWSYLKGDTVGAIDGDDLLALGLERRFTPAAVSLLRHRNATSLANTDWCKQVRDAGLMFLTDRDGIYVFDRLAASDISTDTMTLTDQVTMVTKWVKDAVSRALDLPDPPDVSETALRRAARRAARRQP